MAQSKEQIGKLAAQYPIIGEILAAREKHQARPGAVTIKVQKVDPTFLYQIPRSFLGESGSIFQMKSELKGARQVYIYVVHDTGNKSPMKWDGFDRSNERTILEQIRWLPEEFWSTCRYFVVYTVTNWFERPTRGEQHDGVQFGKYKKTEIDFSVHIVPEKGLASVINVADPAINVVLNSKLLMYGALLRGDAWKEAEKYKFDRASRRLKEIARFLVYRAFTKGGLKKLADKSNGSLKGRCGPIDFSTGAMAGRFQITLSNGTCEASFLGEDSNEYPLNLNVNSLWATVPQVEELAEQFVKIWEQVPADQRIEKFSIVTN